MNTLYNVHGVLIHFNGVITESFYFWGHREGEDMPEEWKDSNQLKDWDGSDRIDHYTIELAEAVDSARHVLRQEINEPVKYFES